MIQQTSIDAYHDLNNSGKLGNLQKLVLNYIITHPKSSQTECATYLSIGKESINPRFAELYNKGFIDEDIKRPCRITGKNVMTWKAIQKRNVEVIHCPQCKQVIRKEARKTFNIL